MNWGKRMLSEHEKMVEEKREARLKAISDIAADMVQKKDTSVATMFRVPELTDSKFRNYCTKIVNDIDGQIVSEGYSLVERRGKRSEGKGATFSAFMELMVSNRKKLSKDDQEIVNQFEQLLVGLLKAQRKEQDFVPTRKLQSVKLKRKLMHQKISDPGVSF